MTDSDGYPAYSDIESALLKHLHGQTAPILPTKIYPVLADYFHLTTEQRNRLRHDKPESLWNNKVQWARRKLVEAGLMNRLPHGRWSLTDKGHQEATKR